jgi:branched-subunit amino acid aminotransferase/4-amino-4-deoxychorismate lyase
VVLETTVGNVAWWEGEELCMPAEELPVLGGVTSLLLRRVAAGLGVPVQPRMATTSDLGGRPVWVLNALHGIRPVSGWMEVPLRAGALTRTEDWNTRLRAEEQPIPD